MRLVTLVVATCLAAPALGAQLAPEPAYDSVAAILRTPLVVQGGYRRFNLPRRDLTVSHGDVTIAPALALGGWVGFDGDGRAAMVMGDLVVTASELGDVERALVAGGIEVQAVHNHLVGEVPAIAYVHLHAHGAPVAIARALDAALARTGTPRPVAAAAGPVTADTARVFAALGARGRGTGAVASVTLELVPGPVRAGGMPLRASLALASPINVQFVSPGRAVATGDFAVTGGQLQPLVRALVTGGVTVTAVHSHLVGESPQVLYVHFWGDGDPDAVLATLRAAADAARRAP